MSSKILRGTLILTLGTYISKLLGLFYVIPFYDIVGERGTILYQYAYIPYTIFISIATAGIPVSVSKFIAKYNALEEYAVGRKLFKSGLVIMLLTGFTAFLILYFSAPYMAEVVIVMNENEMASSREDVTTVIRAVSYALIIIPFMSIIRGYFQGHQSMGPTAVSQVVEQIVRIVFLLVGAYVVLKFLDGELVDAVSVAVFAAFIGGLGGLVVLFVYWYKRKPHLDSLLKKDKGTANVSLPEIYKEIFVYSIPFVLAGISNSLFQYIDLLTFNRAMVSIGLQEKAEYALSILNFQSHKLVIIPVSLATAFALTLVPAITKSFTENDYLGLRRQLDQTFQVLLYLTLPAAVGLSLLAEPLYTLFYEHDSLGTEVLSVYAPAAVLFALYSVTAAIMQGINQQKFTILSLLVGILLKLSLNIPLIKMMETKGAILATVIGYCAAIFINLFVIKYFSDYKFLLVIRRGLLIGLFTAVMYLFTFILYRLLTLFLSPAGKFEALVIVLVCIAFAAGIYFYLGLRSRLAHFLFGPRIDKVAKKLRLHN